MEVRKVVAFLARFAALVMLLAAIHLFRIPKPIYPWADYDLWAPQFLLAAASVTWAVEDWMLRRWGAGLVLKILAGIFFAAISIPIIVKVISG